MIAPPGLLRSLTIVAWGTGGSILIGVCQSVVVARLLGPAGLAHYATILAAITITAQVADGGLANAFAFFGRDRPGALVRLTHLLMRHVAVGIAVAASIVALAWRFDIGGAAAVIGSVWFAAVLPVLLGVTMAATVLPVLVMAAGQYRAYAWFANGFAACQLLMLLLAYAAYGPSWRGFLAAVAGSQMLAVVVQLVYVLRYAGGGGDAQVTAAECYGFGIRIKWAEVMKLMSSRTDLLVVASVLPAGQVGLYSLALGMREFGMTPLRTYSGVLQNLLVDRRHGGLDDRTLVLGSLMLQAAVSAGISLGAALAFPILLPLVYGQDYRAAVVPAVITIASSIFLSVAGICWTVFNMRGEPGTTSAIVTVSGVVGPLLVYALTVRFGLTGAAVATVATSSIAAVLSVVWLARRRGYAARDLPLAARRLRELLRALQGRRPAGSSTQAIV